MSGRLVFDWDRLEQRSSTGVHGAPWGAPKYAWVHHWERVHKKSSQTCHTKQILFTKLLVSKNEPL